MHFWWILSRVEACFSPAAACVSVRGPGKSLPESTSPSIWETLYMGGLRVMALPGFSSRLRC